MTDSTPFSCGPASASLQGKVGRWTLAATLIGMASYSAVEYLIERPADWTSFLLHHVLHVAVIGFAVWIASYFVIRRLVIEPVDKIFVHLRRVAAGKLEFLDCTVRVMEVDHVVESVNHLVTRLQRTPNPDSISQSLDHIRKMRQGLKALPSNTHDDLVPVMKLMTALEGNLLEIMHFEEQGQRTQRKQTLAATRPLPASP